MACRKKEKRHDTALSKRKRQNPQPLPAQRGPQSPMAARVWAVSRNVYRLITGTVNRPQAVEFVDKAASCTMLKWG